MPKRNNKRKSLAVTAEDSETVGTEPSTGRAGNAPPSSGAFVKPQPSTTACPDTARASSAACGAGDGSTALHRIDPLSATRRAEHVFGHSEELAELFDTNPSPVRPLALFVTDTFLPAFSP